jgi:hypothetical protein
MSVMTMDRADLSALSNGLRNGHEQVALEHLQGMADYQSHLRQTGRAPEYGRSGKRLPDMVLPADAYSLTPKRGNVLADLPGLGIMLGAQGGAANSSAGYNSSGDILTRTADGTDLNTLWAEFQRTIALQNEPRQRFLDFLTFRVTSNTETVFQGSGQADFELATEYGEPIGMRTRMAYWQMGYDFDWYDLAARFTWKFLADATTEQVQSLNAQALEADNRNVFTKVMKTVFNSANLSATIDGLAYNVYKFWNGVSVNGATGLAITPPAYKNNTFTATHSHYVTSGAAALDSGDLETMQGLLSEHGYSVANGYSLILMINPVQETVIRGFKFGVTNNNAAVAQYDFIPSLALPDFTLSQTQTIVGNRAPAQFAGFRVLGNYGDFLIISDDYIPAGYMVALASGGPENLGNPVGLREHPNAALRGLRLVKGRTPDYPLIDSFYQRGIGTGIRQRSAGAIMQITTNGSYTIPAIYQ